MASAGKMPPRAATASLIRTENEAAATAASDPHEARMLTAERRALSFKGHTPLRVKTEARLCAQARPEEEPPRRGRAPAGRAGALPFLAEAPETATTPARALAKGGKKARAAIRVAQRSCKQPARGKNPKRALDPGYERHLAQVLAQQQEQREARRWHGFAPFRKHYRPRPAARPPLGAEYGAFRAPIGHLFRRPPPQARQDAFRSFDNYLRGPSVHKIMLPSGL